MAGKFLSHVLPAILRPLRVLWNQVIGFVFLVFAVLASGSAFRSWRSFDGDSESFFRLVLSVVFALIMGVYGISSFLRARRISRS